MFTLLLLLAIVPLLLFTLDASRGSVGIDSGLMPIEPYTTVLRDPSGELDIEEVRDTQFSPVTSFLNFGFTDDAIWLRLDIPEKFNTGEEWIIQIGIPYFDTIDAYQFINQETLHYRKGRDISQRTKPYPHRDSLIPLSFSGDGETTVFLRMRSRDGTGINAHLITSDRMREQGMKAQFFFGAYFGVMISMAIYNLFIFFSLNDRRYLAYVMFTLAVTLNVAAHYEVLPQFAFRGDEWLNARFNLLSFCFAVIASIIFVRSFLMTRDGMPILDRLLRLSVVAFVGVGVYAVSVSYPSSKLLFVLLLPLLIIIAAVGIRALKARNDPASQYFLVAFGVFIIGVGLFSLRRFGLLAPAPLVNYTFMAGSIIETMLLSFALAEQINMLRIQKEETQNLLTKRIREHNQNLEQIKTDLEQTVRARTLKLRGSLREKEILLKEVHHRVKNNLSVIVSLLGFQILREAKGGRASDVLISGRNRVQSMALVHELLCTSEKMTDIDIREYFKRLMQHLQESYVDSAPIVVTQDVDEITLSMDTLVACGLIATELVTNAMKHAFRPDEAGSVCLRIKQDSIDVVLVVEDDGLGMPEDAPQNLGIKLVLLMVEHLDGRLEQDTGNGSRWILRFARPNGEES